MPYVLQMWLLIHIDLVLLPLKILFFNLCYLFLLFIKNTDYDLFCLTKRLYLLKAKCFLSKKRLVTHACSFYACYEIQVCASTLHMLVSLAVPTKCHNVFQLCNHSLFSTVSIVYFSHITATKNSPLHHFFSLIFCVCSVLGKPFALVLEKKKWRKIYIFPSEQTTTTEDATFTCWIYLYNHCQQQFNTIVTSTNANNNNNNTITPARRTSRTAKRRRTKATGQVHQGEEQQTQDPHRGRHS